MGHRNRKALTVLAAVFGVVAIADASAQPLPDRLLQAIDASTRIAEPAPAAGPLAGQAAGASPAGTAAIRMGLSSADLAAPMATLGWNYYTASNCFSVYSNSSWIYTMNMTSGTSIWLSDAGTGAYLGSACAVGAAIAVHVVTVSGTSFTWDAMGFVR